MGKINAGLCHAHTPRLIKPGRPETASQVNQPKSKKGKKFFRGKNKRGQQLKTAARAIENKKKD